MALARCSLGARRLVGVYTSVNFCCIASLRCFAWQVELDKYFSIQVAQQATHSWGFGVVEWGFEPLTFVEVNGEAILTNKQQIQTTKLGKLAFRSWRSNEAPAFFCTNDIYRSEVSFGNAILKLLSCSTKNNKSLTDKDKKTQETTE